MKNIAKCIKCKRNFYPHDKDDLLCGECGYWIRKKQNGRLTADEKIELLITEILELSDMDRGNLFDRMSECAFVDNAWFNLYAAEFLSDVVPEEKEELPDFCGEDIDHDVEIVIRNYGVENIVAAVKMWIGYNLTSDFPRKYKNGIPQF